MKNRFCAICLLPFSLFLCPPRAPDLFLSSTVGDRCYSKKTFQVDKFPSRQRLTSDDCIPIPSFCQGRPRFSACFCPLGCTCHELMLDEVIERNTNAMGGQAAIEAVKSIEVDLHIVDPGFEVDGTYRAMRPGKMRIDVNANGKHVFTEAFDSEHGWQWKGEGNQEAASPKATAALFHGVEYPGKLSGLHEMKHRGHQIELVGRENVDGINHYVLRLTLKDGYTTSLYVDPNSWLIMRRRDVRPLHVDVDPTPTTIELRNSDFREIAGVKFPFATTDTDLKTGKVIESTTVKSIKVNPPFDPTIFEKL